MHAARIEKSKRLQRTLQALRSAGRKGLTTRELARRTGSMAVHSDAAELRANGYDVPCRYDGTSATGRRVYRYTLVRGRK